MAVFAVIVVNEVLKIFFKSLVEFEGHETITEEKLAHTIKLFGSMFLNTAFIVLLILGNINLFTGGSSSSSLQGLSITNLMSGSIADLNSKWYLEVRFCAFNLIIFF
jgi:hypothetical protein